MNCSRLVPLVGLLSLLLFVFSAPSPSYGLPPDTCGVWRWGIKTLSDDRASDVDFAPPATTVQQLRALAKPKPLGKDTPRIGPTELHTYRIRAQLLEHRWVAKQSTDDSDFHLVISVPGNKSRTMIAEIVDPSCPGARDSNRIEAFRAIRTKYVNLFGTVPRDFSNVQGSPVVFVTGVGFFDERHGQRGVAPNGIELHPVLDIDRVP